MSDVFIPVDLDKLLDDFEEQDSSVSSPRQSSVIHQGKTFPISGLPANNTSDTSLNNSKADSDSVHTDEANNGKLNTDLLSPDVPVRVSSLIVNASLQSNGEAGHTIEPPGQKDIQQCSSCSMDNLMDLTDVEVSSRTSVLNEVNVLGDVVSQSQALRPDMTNDTTDERTCASQNNFPNDPSVNLTNSLHRDILLLDIGNSSDDSIGSNFNYTQKFIDDSNDQNLLNKEVVKELSVAQDRVEDPDRNLMNFNMPAGSFSHGDNENSLIDLTTEVTKQNLPDSLIDSVSSTATFPTKSTKENFNQNFDFDDPKRNDFSATETRHVERSGHYFSYQNTQTTSANQALVDEAPILSNNLEALAGTNSSTSSDPYRTNKFNRASDDNNHAANSNIPLVPEGEASLLFMQDHFGNSEMAGDTIDNINTSVCVNSENYPTGTNNGESNGESKSEIDGRQETQVESIPVAQDIAAEASEEPATMGNSYEILESEQAFQIGYSAPPWLPDNNVNRCMSCQCKFTVVKRRHHCRACGKIYCSSCCNLKFNLQYLDDKLARVCQACANVLLQRQAALTNQNTSDAALTNQNTSESDTDEAAMYVYLNPDQPQPPVRPSNDVEDVYSPAEQPPEYEETEVRNSPSVEVASLVPVFTDDNMTESASQVTQFRPTTCSSSSSLSSTDIQVISNVPLPPVLRKTDEGLKVDDSPNHQEILYLLKKRKETVTFLLNKNLVVKVRIVKLNCCVKRKIWCFSSEGMQAADQEDMVILLECIPKESSIPQDVLSHFNTAFAYAKQGHRVTDLGYTIFGQPFLGSLRNAGFLYIKSSFQCLENLVLPSGPHIFGVLIQREEVSWVQLFPIRLILRLGAEYRYYPSPLWSVRDREPLFGEIGHTIMDLLADFKNFQYTLPRVTGMHVHLEDKKAVIQLPQNRYDEVLKVLNATDEYVMAFEATFSNVADSHLVCIQEGTGYKTQSINLEGQERKVTGASFVVFNGALKTTTDIKAKVSIVEDGVMVQMVRQLSEEMRQAMREMSDFTIHTGCPESDSGSVQQVVFEWVSKRNPDVQSVLSPIDGLTLGTTSDIKINTHFDFSTPSIYRLRWTQLFFLERTEERPRNLPAQFKQTTADIAKACTVALRPYLYNLYLGDKHRIGLRVNLSPDMVGYIIGSQGSPLPDEMANNLDNELVPAIHNAVNPSSNTPTSMEFLFNIVEMLS